MYNNAKFWLNEKLLGENPYGYSPVYFEVTDFINDNTEENIFTVRVDHSRYADSRWYTGSGIYRNVKIITLNKLHIPVWGTYITTPEITANKATVHLEVKVENDIDSESSFTLSTEVIDSEGNKVAKKVDQVNLSAKGKDAFYQRFTVARPKLWDCENPNMYKAITSIIQDGEIVDKYTTPFGIRSLRFDKDQGFFLNGKPTLAKGVCLHHDGGLVGAAVPKGVWKRRLEKLKEAGCNAIRTSHNPYSQEFLDLCDELGFLVQNEFFDEMDLPKDKRRNYHDHHDDYITRGYTEHFQEWGKSDLTRTMLRDRNHPCVFEWSIGNEIEWTYLHYRYVTGQWFENNTPNGNGSEFWRDGPKLSPEELKERYDAVPERKYVLAETAKRINGWVKELDTTRPTTANLIIPQVSLVSGYADAIDVVGYSRRYKDYHWARKHFPDKIITWSENSFSWETWKYVIENPGAFSEYMWTGIAYMGEADGRWPGKGSGGIMLDFAGFERQGWNYFKSVWVNEPHISIGTNGIYRT